MQIQGLVALVSAEKIKSSCAIIKYIRYGSVDILICILGVAGIVEDEELYFSEEISIFSKIYVISLPSLR